MPAYWSAASDAFVIMIIFMIIVWHRKNKSMSIPDLGESADASAEAPQPPGGNIIVDANNVAVQHMIRAYRYPTLDSWHRYGLLSAFWIWTLFASLFFGDAIFRISGFPWWRPLLIPAWIGASLAIIAFVLLQLHGYLRDHLLRGASFFWNDRCRKSVEDIKRTNPAVASYLLQQPPADLPWWWLYHRRKASWLSKVGALIVPAGSGILAAVTLFWGWYGIEPNVLHRPHFDTLTVAAAAVEIACATIIHKILTIQLASWTGATNRSYPTFSLAVLRQDLL